MKVEIAKRIQKLNLQDRDFYMVKQRLDPAWRPLCLSCRSKDRMIKEAYGFSCTSCGSSLNRDMTKRS